MKKFQVPYELTGYVVVEAESSTAAATAGKAMVEKLTEALYAEGEIFGRVPSRGGVTEIVQPATAA